MFSLSRRQGRPGWGGVLLACLAALALLAGCGGGGGGGGPTTGTTGGGGTGNTVTLTGVLADKTTGILLTNRTVTVQGTALAGVTNAQGQFSIAGVPTTAITLVVTDSIGSVDGALPVNVSKLSGGGTRSAGTLVLDLSNLPPPPPIS